MAETQDQDQDLENNPTDMENTNQQTRPGGVAEDEAGSANQGVNEGRYEPYEEGGRAGENGAEGTVAAESEESDAQESGDPSTPGDSQNDQNATMSQADQRPSTRPGQDPAEASSDQFGGGTSE